MGANGKWYTRPRAMCGVAEGLRLSGAPACHLSTRFTPVKGSAEATTRAVASVRSRIPQLHSAVDMCRFSHAAAVLHDQVVITHGFFYDVEARAAQWLSDTWSMSVLSPYTWKKLHSGFSILLQSSLVSTKTVCSCKRVNVCIRWRRCSCSSQGI